MKTFLKTNVAIAYLAIILGTMLIPITGYPSFVTPFRKISVKGNVEVVLIQNTTQGVAYADNNIGNVKVIQKDDMLSITGTSKQQSKVIVYVNDIFRIEAGDHVIINTQGELNTKFLQIFLKGDAVANIKTSTQGLYTSILDNARLKLSGSTDDHALLADQPQKLSMVNFVAFKTHILPKETESL